MSEHALISVARLEIGTPVIHETSGDEPEYKDYDGWDTYEHR